MTVREPFQLEGLRKAGLAVAKALHAMRESLETGITTLELDEVGKRVLDGYGAVSAPKKDYGFPGTTCISVNEEVAHGIPGKRRIEPGDLVNFDVSACLDGYYADTGFTVLFRSEDRELRNLCACSSRALNRALKVAKAGAKINLVGKAIEDEARKEGFSTIRNLSGHGTGSRLHEPPDGLVNYYDPRIGGVFRKGMVLAIETFVSTGASQADEMDDGWTLTTPDGSFVAQYEHTVVVTEGEPLIMTRL